MKLKIAVVTLLAIITLTACNGGNTKEGISSKVNDTQNIKELVNDYSAGSKQAKNASITSRQLTVTNKDGSETVSDLPKDEFFVSIAPYVSQTHP